MPARAALKCRPRLLAGAGDEERAVLLIVCRSAVPLRSPTMSARLAIPYDRLHGRNDQWRHGCRPSISHGDLECWDLLEQLLKLYAGEAFEDWRKLCHDLGNVACHAAGAAAALAAVD